MNDWIAGMSPLERVFTFCAFIGIILFAVRLVLQILGADDGAEGDISDVDDIGDTDVSFKFMSIHGITIFLLMFGLIGRALLLDSKVGETVALVGAFAGAVVSVFMIAQVYLFMKRLQSSGNIRLQNAVGKEGTVYLNIPPGGSGQIQVTFQNKLHVRDAISEDGSALRTGDPVVVTGVRGADTLIVRKQESPARPATTQSEGSS